MKYCIISLKSNSTLESTIHIDVLQSKKLNRQVSKFVLACLYGQCKTNWRHFKNIKCSIKWRSSCAVNTNGRTPNSQCNVSKSASHAYGLAQIMFLMSEEGVNTSEQWSNTHRSRNRIICLSISTKNKEIHVTNFWGKK